MNIIPFEEKSFFVYKSPQESLVTTGDVLYSFSLEVQLSIEENLTAHDWHIFIHLKTPYVTSKFYKISNTYLYDAIVQAVQNFDLSYATQFFALCILKGDWHSSGVLEGKVMNKRLWFHKMFDNDTLVQLKQDFTPEQCKYFEKFI